MDLEKGVEAAAEAVGPVGDGEVEGVLDECLVENRISRTFDLRRELVGVAGEDFAGGPFNVMADLIGHLRNHLGKVVP